MKYLILANGEYGDLRWYQDESKFDHIICADAGASKALEFGLKPELIVGDLDSLAEKDAQKLRDVGCEFSVYPREKDYTDTHLALLLAEDAGATEITVWGGTGSRLDHTLGSLFAATELAEKGAKVCFASPEQMIYLIKDELRLQGNIGETVSVMALLGRAEGVTLKGFHYPLSKATLESRSTLGVSNVIVAQEPLILVEQGIVTVFHYPGIREPLT